MDTQVWASRRRWGMEGGLESPQYVSTVEVKGKDDATHWEGVKSEQMKPWERTNT